MEDGTQEVHYLEPTYLARSGDLVPDWMRGCYAVDRRHPLVEEWLAIRGIDADKAILRETVPVLSFAMLAASYKVTTLDCLKVDSERMDLAIIESYQGHCKSSGMPLADSVMLEISHISRSGPSFQRIRSAFERAGYAASFPSSGEDVIFRPRRGHG